MPKKGSSLLSDTSVRSAKAKEKTQMLRYGDGLWLMVEPTGRKWCKLRVVFAKKENSFSLGDYPDTSLALAREKKDAIRRQIAEGVDPGIFRRTEKAKEKGDGSFEAVAREWHAEFSPKWTEHTRKKNIRILELNAFPWIGERKVDELSAP